MFPGQLESLSREEAAWVDQIKFAVGGQKVSHRNYEWIWTSVQAKIQEVVVRCDSRVFKHLGVLDYKSFEIDAAYMTQEQAESEVRRILATHEFIGKHASTDYHLSSGLNRRRFRFEDRVYGDEVCQLEELCFIRSNAHFPEKVLEIGCGDGKLTLMMAERGAKVMVIDFPGMWAKAAFSLMHAGFKVGLGIRNPDMLGKYDVIFTGPHQLPERWRFDLAVCVHALGEMTKEDAMGYLGLIRDSADSFFTCGYGITNKVPEMIPDLLGWRTVAARYAFYDAWTHPRPMDVMAMFVK